MIPGLKYLGVFLNWMVYGDLTILIFFNSASTISPPEKWCREGNCLRKAFRMVLDCLLFLGRGGGGGGVYAYHIFMWLNSFQLLTTITDMGKEKKPPTILGLHNCSYVYGTPHQFCNWWEGLEDVLSLQCGYSFTFVNLLRVYIKKS